MDKTTKRQKASRAPEAPVDSCFPDWDKVIAELKQKHQRVRDQQDEIYARVKSQRDELLSVLRDLKDWWMECDDEAEGSKLYERVQKAINRASGASR